MNLERWELIYDQINGLNVPGVCEWVKDESSLEGAVGPLVEQIMGPAAAFAKKRGWIPTLTRILSCCSAGWRGCPARAGN